MIVKLVRHGSDYYLREFRPKPALPDYEITPPRMYYEAVTDPREASNFDSSRAHELAALHHGQVIE